MKALTLFILLTVSCGYEPSKDDSNDINQPKIEEIEETNKENQCSEEDTDSSLNKEPLKEDDFDPKSCEDKYV